MSKEEIFDELRKGTVTTHEDPARPFAKITIPDSGKIGGDLIIKVDKKVKHLQLAVSHDFRYGNPNPVWDRNAPPQIYGKPFTVITKKNVDEIIAKWEDIGILREEKVNLLPEGEYLVEVRAYTDEAYEETTARRIVRVTK